MFELDAGISGGEAPGNGADGGMTLRPPGGHLLDAVRPVQPGAPVADGHRPPAAQGFAHQEHVADAVAGILVILADGLAGLPRHFYRRAARVIDTPWQLAAGGDFAYPEVTVCYFNLKDLLNW